MATLDVKFSKFDNRPWGFRLAGGADFPQPLTVIRVTEGSLAECMGLKVGDVVVKINDQPIYELTHGQAHEALMLAGNNFVLSVRRTEDPSKAIEGIEEKIEPYMLPIEEILFAPIEEKRETTPDEAPQIQDEAVPVEPVPEVEKYPEKPRDENSEIVAKTDLTDEEIALLILDEEEVLTEKGVLGVNFKKLRPRVPLLKDSKVLKELQQEIDKEPEQIQELKHQTTFLQKPDRPVPKPRSSRAQSEESIKPDNEPQPEPYRVVIKKQPKKSITERLLEKGLIEPSRVKTPETGATATTTTQASEVIEPYNNEPTLLYQTSYEALTDSESETSESQTIIQQPPTVTFDLHPISDTESERETNLSSLRGTWSFVSQIEEEEDNNNNTSSDASSIPISEEKEEMLPINEEQRVTYDEFKNETIRKSRPRLCRRGRYARRCLERALDSLKAPSTKNSGKPRLLRRGRYFERIVRDVRRSLAGETETDVNDKATNEESFLRVLLLAQLANSLRDTYDTEILHRGSSRRNSRRMSSSTCRRESNANLDNGYYVYKPIKEQDCITGFSGRYAEGRRRLSVMSMMVADKVTNAMRSDLARGLAYALVPCASGLAFFMYNYIKRINEHE